VQSLRDRGDDVIRLAEHFISEFAKEYGRRPKRLSLGAMVLLREYRWPGNVRELRNVIERLMITVPGELVAPEDLGFLDIAELPVTSGAAPAIQPLLEARDAWERRYILGAIAAFDGNISRTADALGLERSNLYKKMRGLGIAPTHRDDA
jgi:two-component system nitrogen regulation response regulator NtrX